MHSRRVGDFKERVLVSTSMVVLVFDIVLGDRFIFDALTQRLKFILYQIAISVKVISLAVHSITSQAPCCAAYLRITGNQ